MLLYAALAFGDALSAVPWCDEAWLSSPALTFLRHGFFGTPILTSYGWGPPMGLTHIAQRTYWIMPLQMLNEAAWFRLFGYSLLALRSLSIFWGGVALLAIAVLVFELTRNRTASLLSVLITGTDYFFLTRASDGRMDMMAAALMFSAMAGYLFFRRRSLVLASAVAGICVAGSFFTHPVGGFFAISGTAFLALYFDRRRLRFQHLVIFSVPFLLIGGCWAAYISRDLPAFKAQITGNAKGRWEGITRLGWSVYAEARYKYLQAYGLNNYATLSLHDLRLTALATYFFSLCAVACTRRLRKRTGVRVLLTLSILFIVGGMAFDGAKRWYYLVHVVPLLAALTAVYGSWLWKTRRIPRPVTAAALTALLAMQVGGTLFRIRKDDYKTRFLPAANFAISHDPHHELIFGGGELGFVDGFPEYLVDDLSLGYFSGRKARVLFVPETYWGLWLDNLRERDPPVSRFVAQTMQRDYNLAYQNPSYRVYLRKP